MPYIVSHILPIAHGDPTYILESPAVSLPIDEDRFPFFEIQPSSFASRAAVASIFG